MELPAEVIKKGRITVYNDTPFEIVKAAEEYNKHLYECRKKSKFVEEIEFGYLVMNLLLGLTVSALVAQTALETPFVTIPIMLLNAFSYIFFAFIKRNLMLSTICAALFIVVNLLYIPLVVADFVLFFMHRHIIEELKKEPAYPSFAELQVHYERGNKPAEKNQDSIFGVSEDRIFEENNDITVEDNEDTI